MFYRKPIRRKGRRKKIMDAREMGRKGGRERAKRLSPERRHEIAVQGGQASKAARKKKAQRPNNLKNHKSYGGK